MKQLKTLKTFWNILCGVFVCMAFFNFLMPDSGNEEMLIYRLFYVAMAILFGVASVSFRALIKELEEIKDKNI